MSNDFLVQELNSAELSRVLYTCAGAALKYADWWMVMLVSFVCARAGARRRKSAVKKAPITENFLYTGLVFNYPRLASWDFDSFNDFYLIPLPDSLRQAAFVKTPAGKADFDRRSAAKVIAHSERRLVTGFVRGL